MRPYTRPTCETTRSSIYRTMWWLLTLLLVLLPTLAADRGGPHTQTDVCVHPSSHTTTIIIGVLTQAHPSSTQTTSTQCVVWRQPPGRRTSLHTPSAASTANTSLHKPTARCWSRCSQFGGVCSAAHLAPVLAVGTSPSPSSYPHSLWQVNS